MDGRFISVYGTTKGGTGRIVAAINLSFAVKNNLKRQDEKIALVDFDFSASSVVPILVGMEGTPAKSAVSLSSMIDALDAAVLPDFLLKHPSGVEILQGIGDGEENIKINQSGIAAIADIMKKTYSYIIANTEKEFNEKLVMTFDLSNLILLVINPDVISVHKAKIFLDELVCLHYPVSLVKVVVNSADIKGALSKSKIEEFLHQPVFFEIPYDKDVVVTSMNHGTPAVLSFPRSAFSKSINSLAALLIKNQEIYIEPDDASKERIQGIAALAKECKLPVGPAVDPGREEKLKKIRNTLQKKLLEEMDIKVFDAQKDENVQKEIRGKVKVTLEKLLSQESADVDSLLPTREERTQFILKLLDEVLGLGPLEPLLRDPTITEIMVNSKDKIFIERNGKITLTNDRFASNDQLKSVIERIVSTVGRHVDESSPLCDARLRDGSRVNAIIPPLALDGPSLTIRKFSEKKLSVDDLVAYGSLVKEMGEFLKICVLTRKNILISGGTGSGKTTLLNILSAFIPSNERIVTIEDSAELKLWQENIVRLEARPSSVEGTGEIPIRRLVINALRMRPDRIVVGECRGGEALDMLQAMNTGHDGSLTTLHANSPRDALSRLETVVLMAGMELPSRSIKEQIRSAINIIVQLSRMLDGSRKITSISEITGMEGDTITTQEIFRYDQKGISKEGKVIGSYEPTGIIPTFVEELKVRGIKLDFGIFEKND